MPIEARHSGWAEQDPDLWWYYVGVGLDALREAGHPLDDVRAVGITYQMHGLVCVDCTGHPLRKAIIWCDSRAVEIGAEALETLGRERCLEHLLNSPGNFTASKLAWVRRNEPELFARIDKVMPRATTSPSASRATSRPPWAASRSRFSGTSPRSAAPTSWPTTTASPTRCCPAPAPPSASRPAPTPGPRSASASRPARPSPTARVTSPTTPSRSTCWRRARWPPRAARAAWSTA